MAITKAERAALAKIVDNRFKMLQAELDTRRERIARQIRDRIVEESQQAVLEGEKRLQALADRAQALQAEVVSAVRQLERELQVTTGYFYEEAVYTDSSPKHVVKRWRTRKNDPIALTIDLRCAPLDIERRIADELAALGHERSAGGRSVDAMRLDLQEELLLGTLEGADARQFLDKIPAVDDILPMPEPATLPAGKPTRKRTRK